MVVIVEMERKRWMKGISNEKSIKLGNWIIKRILNKRYSQEIRNLEYLGNSESLDRIFKG